VRAVMGEVRAVAVAAGICGVVSVADIRRHRKMRAVGESGRGLATMWYGRGMSGQALGPPRFNMNLYGWTLPDGTIVPDPSFRQGLPDPDSLLACEIWQDGDGFIWRMRYDDGRYKVAPLVAPTSWAYVDEDPRTSRWLVELLRPYGMSWPQVAREAARKRVLLDRASRAAGRSPGG